MKNLLTKKINPSIKTAKKISLIFFLMSLIFGLFIVLTVNRQLVNIFAIVVSIACMAAFVFVAPYDAKPMAEGKVYVLIPAYNEEPQLLYNALEAILNQTRVPDAIYVMDDGSAIPIPPYEHPLVHWYRQENAGKRHAQAGLLREISRDEVDFFLTIDSDSVLEVHAVERLLKAMSDPGVYAATGTVVTRNYNQNLLTYIEDLNIGRSCVQSRSSHSVLGAMETTSGALAIYRKEVLSDNLSDYINSGTYGDDRRLCTYANLYGKTVGVDEAYVFSEMPDTISKVWKQRLRWAKGGWRGLPFMLINYNLRQAFFPIWGAIQKYIFLAISLFYLRNPVAFLVVYTLLNILLRIPCSAAYLLMRPRMSILERIVVFLLITPLEALFSLYFLWPISYYALFKLRDNRWYTR